MANSDIRGKNRFLDSKSSEEQVGNIKPNDVILNIMKDEFPDDIFYRNNRLSNSNAARQALDSFRPIKGKGGQLQSKDLPSAERNDKNVLDLSVKRKEYAEYDLAKSFPTIDEDELDELIDEP